MGWDWKLEKYPDYIMANGYPESELPADLEGLLAGVDLFKSRHAVAEGVSESRRQGVRIVLAWLGEIRLRP